jgi:PAS domain S-box-containing protein
MPAMATTGAGGRGFSIEARERLLMEAERIAHCGSFAWHVTTGTIHWSDELYRILGEEPGSIEPSAERFFAGVHPEDLGRVQAVAQRGVATGVAETVGFRIVRPDGTVRHVSMNGAALTDDDGQPSRFVGTIVDLTERVQLEEELLRAQKLDALGRLAGGVAHDFNNLLTVIGLHVERLGRQRTDADLRAITAAVEHGTDLTRRLLAFTRQVPLATRAVDLAEVIEDTGRLVARLLDERVRFVFAPPPGRWRVVADPSQLTQVAMNLVLNARDAMPDGGTIELSLEHVTLAERRRETRPPLARGEYVVLRVRDEGLGMTEPVKASLFEPFFTTKPVGVGTGLGLPLVLGILEQLGGGVEVTTEAGRGSTFSVYLPAAADEAVDEAPAEPRARRGGGQRILLIEDQVVLRDAIAELLGTAGYTVHAASDADDALALFAAHGRDVALVVTDIVLPGQSGPEAVARMRVERPALQVLYMSGYAPEGVGALGAATFLAKPFRPDDLLSSVATLLR